jgi:hypothetical protein
MSQSSDSSRHSGLSVAIIGGIFTIIAAIIGLGVPIVDRMINHQPDPPTLTRQSSPQALIAATEDMVALHRPSLMSAVRLIGDVESRAMFNLDPTPLNTVFTGEALRNEQAKIMGLQQDNVYVVAVRHDLQFNGFTVNSDGTRAEVRVNPIWESTMYLLGTHQCIGYVAPMETPQTVYLERTASGWMTYAIVFDIPNVNWQPCK